MRLNAALGTSFTLWIVAALAGACASSVDGDDPTNAANPFGVERDGGGIRSDAAPPPIDASGPDGGGPASCEGKISGVGTVQCSASLFVTEKETLAKFSLSAVMSQIVATSQDSSLTALALYQQLLDTLNDKKTGVTSGPHCDGKINGFPVECPRQEGILASTDPFKQGSSESDAMFPVGVVNRFDLAPANGENCGQYRVVFAKQSGLSDPFNRFFLIFEAVLPNPGFVNDGTSHLASCAPVAQLWADLSTDTPAERATALEGFYFKGLTGFAPVIQAANYGYGNGGGTNSGQIRANMFMFDTGTSTEDGGVPPPGEDGGPLPPMSGGLVGPPGGQEWELREFRLSQTCSGKDCAVVANDVVVQANPFGALFGSGETLSSAFQKEFVSQIPSLATSVVHGASAVVPLISMTTPDRFSAGESDEQDTSNDYAAQDSTKAFLATIKSELTKIDRSDLSAEQILNRATTQSCAGCHEVAVGADLGDGINWPGSNGFTQIDESSNLSPALTGFFLPFRLQVLKDFLEGKPPPSDPTHTVGGQRTGAPN
jgi:hypothetical protein